MNSRKKEALKLRIKGLSYNEINRKLGIPKSTLSNWLKDVVLSEQSKQRIERRKSIGTEVLIKRNKLQTKQAWKRAKNNQHKGLQKIGDISDREMMLVGAVLYWGEGYKKLKTRNGVKITNHIISLVNADPEIIRIFTEFLVKALRISPAKIEITMRLFKHINEETALKYWSKVTGLPRKNFSKTSYPESRSSRGKRPYNRLPYGTVAVRVSDTNKFHELIGLIEGIKKFAKL